MKEEKYVLIAIMLFALTLSMGCINVKENNTATSYRPEHCYNDGCMESWRFQQLPEYPKNLETVAMAVARNKLLISENFSETMPDENYWKQPEWYAPQDKVFDTQGVPIYIDLINKIRRWEAMTEEERKNAPPLYTPQIGWGAYPANLIVQELHEGQTAKTITFIRNGWAIVKYQEFEMGYEFPTNEKLSCLSSGYNNIINPENTSEYFDVSISPNLFLLTPTYPEFTYGWSERVVIEITTKENIPKGKYAMALVARSVSSEQHDINFRKYWGELADGSKRGGYPYIVCINVV